MATASASKGKLKIRPLGDKVLIKRLEAEAKTKSGIFLPEAAKEKPQEAKVLAVGEGRTLKDGGKAPFQVKVGDKVLIGKWSGTEIKVEDEELLILPESEILAVLD